MKKIIYLLSLVFAVAHSSFAQKSATGSWYGRADVEMAGMHNNYLTELIIRQKGNKVDGIFGYYFKDKYTSFFVHGHYNPKTREIRILNIPVIYFNSNSTANSVDCNTNFLGKLMISKTKTSVTGYFYHDDRYKYTCPDLRVHYTLDRGENKQDSILSNATAGTSIWKPQADDIVVDASENQKEDTTAVADTKKANGATVATVMRSDSVQPDNGTVTNTGTGVTPATANAKTTPAGTITKTTPTSIAPASAGTGTVSGTNSNTPATSSGTAPAVASTKTTPPTEATTVPADATKTTGTTGVPADVTKTTGTTGVPAVGTAPLVDSQAVAQEKARVAAEKARVEAKEAAEKAAAIAKADAKKITESFAKRKTIPAGNKALEVVSDSVRVSFYDNGIIDGDSISVFLNHQLILSHQELQAKALTLFLHLDSLKEVNEISMFAENLGKYPPNTALMVVTDGVNRYEVFMSSSLTQNAAILLRRRER